MTPITSSFIQSTRALTVGCLLALGLAACGSASEPPLGESEQPISAGDGEDTADACAAGSTPAQGDPGADCQVVANGLCFETAAAACACAGCGSDECLIAESFPAQAFCPSTGGGDGADPNAPVSSGPIGGPINGGTNGSSGNGTSSSPGCAGPTDPGQTPPSDPAVPAQCDFLVDGDCYGSAAEACAAAGCDDAACLIQESYPATVFCQ